MSEKIPFGHSKKRQRELVLQYADELRDKAAWQVSPNEITRCCFKRGLFLEDQVVQWGFDGARRFVESCLKQRDDSGLERWAQLPLANDAGELVWERRKEMSITGFAWNYLMRDTLSEKNAARRDLWREEAVGRWGAKAFEREVHRLRTVGKEQAG
jgi:hypothetical protein